MMNDNNIDQYLDQYGKNHSPEPSRDLINNIMAIPREVEQEAGFLTLDLPVRLSEWFLFLIPRLSGLTAACVLGIYFGSAGSSALAEDEIAAFDQEVYEFADGSIILDENVETLLDVEEFIFVEEIAQ